MRYRNYGFLLGNLILRDFRIRYRNMSLGVFWSLLNPLVMMAVLTFVFTRIYPTATPNFHVFVLCGIIPFNFFASAWVSGTTSIYQSAGLVKKVILPREVLPIATVLASCIHYLIQIGLLVVVVLLAGYPVNGFWVLLPAVFGLQVVFVCGLSLISSALDVYFRDIRYVVESANTVLFWLVPIFYPFDAVPSRFHSLYQYNPVAAVVLACRNILLEDKAPPPTLLYKLLLVSVLFLAVGFFVFRRLKRKFADYL
ncbi:MAG TPA: ABC transporter permease [Bryobacteraceae bacterium]|nr:ABC transporter permease [Bryobacteraceae bacterium]